MKKNLLYLLLLSLICNACSNSAVKIFARKTPLEKYAEQMAPSLNNSPEGRQWVTASRAALSRSYPIQLPYRQLGTFPAGKSHAMALSFTAKQGETLQFEIVKNNTAPISLYKELYKIKGPGDTVLLEAPDTAAMLFQYVVKDAGLFMLKLQPQLYQSGSYQLSISVGPSLGFPVGGTKATVGSFWGDGRDGGKRLHEGIDIFAAKGTAAVAAADGRIVAVREGGLGGKTVWLQPDSQPFNLYYAHLDKQLVQEGQTVILGETIGLVGNTGNAAHTAAHLHFGVYGVSGAVDPLPFVNRQQKTAPPIASHAPATALRLLKDLQTPSGLIKKNAVLIPLAITSKGYLAELPDGGLFHVQFSFVKPVSATGKEGQV